jgi:nuclear transport factor 2 (NTF2) superfamily protein
VKAPSKKSDSPKTAGTVATRQKSLAYSLDTQWRNRAEFATNREEAQAFLERKWKKSWVTA